MATLSYSSGDQSNNCPVFIGREAHLASLDYLIEFVLQGQGKAARISGEAGIGKSRLCAEVKSHAQSKMLILEGHCFEQDFAIPYAPWIDLLRTFFSTHSPQTLERRFGRLAAAIGRIVPALTIHGEDPIPDPQMRS